VITGLLCVVACAYDYVVYDQEGAFHALKRLHGEVSDYIVVVYYMENEEGCIRTAFYKVIEGK